MKNIYLIFPFLTLVFVLFPLFNNQFFAVHDDQQVARVYLMHQAFWSDQFPVRWVNHLGFGYGYPLFIFYPPLIYYLGTLIHSVGISLILTVKIIIALSFILSFVTMYLFSRKFFSKEISLISSSFYLLTSYRAVDVYVRGALSEAFSFIFLPLVLLYSFNLFEKNTVKNFILLAFSFSFLILTHTLTALGFLVILLVWFVFLTIKTRRYRSLIFTFASLGLGGGLSAFSSIPSLLEKKFTLVDGILLTELADFRIHFLYLRQLWSSAWGYGGSLPELNDGLSFEIGKLLIIILPIVLGILIITLYKKRKIQIEYIFPLLLVLSIVMTTKYSKPVWQLFQPLAYLQFPWRYLAFVSVFPPLVFGLAANLINKLNKKIAIIFLIISFGIFIFEAWGRFQPAQLKPLSDDDYLTTHRLDWQTSRSSFEYIPKGVITKVSSDLTTIPDIDENEISTTPVKITSGDAEVENILFKPGKQKYYINSRTNSSFRFNTFYFPGWVAELNGQVYPISDNNDLKLIDINIPPGIWELELTFTRTLIRGVSEIISLVSLAFIGLLLIYKTRLKNVRH